MKSSNSIYGFRSTNGVDIRKVVEALYRKDGVWDSLPKEERENLENKKQLFERRTCYGEPIDDNRTTCNN